MTWRWWVQGMALLLAGGLWALPGTRRVLVDGHERTALVYPGKNAASVPSPLVLVFHGFGGTSSSAAYAAELHQVWPEATVVYPQGSTVTMRTTPPQQNNGWQFGPGREDDKDLKFIDVLLRSVKDLYLVDPHRIFACGVSNGALFTYMLLTYRPHDFTAFAIVAGTGPFVTDATVPKPVLIIQGKRDTTVKLSQSTDTRDLLLKLNRCGTTTVPWGPGCITYTPCATGKPVVWCLHDGGHIWPSFATSRIVRFFIEQGETQP